MIIQITKTHVDDDDADVDLFNVADITDEEVDEIRRLADGSEWEEPVTFRGVEYEYPQDVTDILSDIGERINPDVEIHVYEY